MGVRVATKCIICEKTKAGEPVADDLFIRAVRRIKQAVGIAKNNRLVVCRGCMEKHLERRAKFEKGLVRYGMIGAIIAVVFLLMAPSLMTLVWGLCITLLMLSFSLVNYHPSLVNKAVKRKAKPKKKTK